MEKINMKKDWKFFVILLIIIICILLIATYTLSINNKLYTTGETQNPTGIVQEIDVGTKILQSFKAVDNNLEKVVINFEPYANDVNVGGKAKISILDNKGTVIKQEEITRNYVREKNNYEFKFKKQKNSENKEYTILLEFEDLQNADKFYSVKSTDKNEFDTNKLIINGEEQQGTSLIFQDYYKSNIRTGIFTGIIIVMVIGVFVISTIIYYKRDLKVENMFLMIAPIVCIFFMIVMPTFKNHDEYYHWLKAYEVSIGNLMTPIEEGIQGSLMPEGVSAIFPGATWTSMDYKDVQEILKIGLQEEKQGILNPETAAVYSFVQYIPQAVGIAIARIFTNSAYLITYGGRIMNLIVSLVVLYFAIKIMPFGKKLILIPAMIPIAIEGFSSLSPDSMTISVAFLYIAYILYLAFGNKEKIETKDKIILLVMSIIVALCKIVYIPLVGLMLIIPKEKFKENTNKNKILNISIIAGIAVVINLIWLALAGRYLSTFREGDSAIQVLLAIKNPIEYIQKLLYTINLYGNNYLMSLFGADLGWGELIRLNSIIPYTILGIYLFTAITDNDIKGKFKKYQLIWITLITLAIIALVFTSLYVQWTTVGSTSILGVQGRYFLPIIPLIMILLGSIIKVKSDYKEESITKFVGISMLVLHIYTIAQIMIVHL